MKKIKNYLLPVFLLPVFFLLTQIFVVCRPLTPAKMNLFSAWAGHFFICLLLCELMVVAVLLLLKIKLFRLSWAEASLLCLFFFVFFFFERQIELVTQASHSPWLRKRYIEPLIVLALATIGWVAIRKKKAAALAGLFNWVILSLIVYQVYAVYQNRSRFASKNFAACLPSVSIESKNKRLPDVVYVLLDSYTSSRNLKEYWNYDNAPFEKKLTDLGFQIAADSHTSFDRTQFCMTSIMNLCADSALVASLSDMETGYWMNHNLVCQTFARAGYQIQNFSIFEIQNTVYPNSPFGYAGRAPGLIQNLISQFVILSLLEGSNRLNFFEKNRAILADLADTVQTQRPQFTYAHIVSPHVPYVIDSTGALTHVNTPSNDAQAYLAQLKGLNQWVVQWLAHFLSSRKGRESVIVIQGDHGFRYLPGQPWRESSGVLSAFYFPEKNHAPTLPANLPPTNSFRFIFRYLNTQ
ncbi:MAG: hypothetical protein JSS93_11730 [Bacteroidetes bacterium]|nr:hypothetical protein [Bacteroidota bacterium]